MAIAWIYVVKIQSGGSKPNDLKGEILGNTLIMRASIVDFQKGRIKMSECLRTYGPQIIRVPQLQSED